MNRSTMPRFRSFFRVGDMPYEFSEEETSLTVRALLEHGAAEVTVRRYIVDENSIPDNEPTVDPDNEA